MADLKNKYLNYTGLGTFTNLLAEYIENRIGKINGSNVNAYAQNSDKPVAYETISDNLNALWKAIGVDGGGSGDIDISITEKLEGVLGEYVKSIATPTNQTEKLKLKIEEGTGDNADRFTISIVDNGLADLLDTLTDERVSNLQVDNDGGAITLTVDKNTGNVKLTVNSKALTERVENIEGNYVKDIVTSNTNTGTQYIVISPNTKTNGNVSININDSTLAEKIKDIDDYTINNKKISTNPVLSGDDI
jgi:hypothetical protein